MGVKCCYGFCGAMASKEKNYPIEPCGNTGGINELCTMQNWNKDLTLAGLHI